MYIYYYTIIVRVFQKKFQINLYIFFFCIICMSDTITQSDKAEQTEQTAQSEEQKRIIDLFEGVKEEAEAMTFEKLSEGNNIIDLREIESMKVETREFTKEDGTTNKVRRLVVMRKGNEVPLYLPISVYNTLKKFVENGIMKVNIIKEGSGLSTKYTCIPA